VKNTIARDVRRGFLAHHRQHRDAGSKRLADLTPYFIFAGALCQYDPRFLASKAAVESAWGNAKTLKRWPYNFWGWNITDSGFVGPEDVWRRPETAFRYFAEGMNRNYRRIPTVTHKRWKRYASAGPEYEETIAQVLEDWFRGDPDDILWLP
jgi:hypothetical protein